MRQKRKTYPKIRQLILNEFSKGERTVNEIAQNTGLTWRTVDGHIIWLIGKGIIEPVFVSSYVKIYRKRETEISKTVNGTSESRKRMVSS